MRRRGKDLASGFIVVPGIIRVGIIRVGIIRVGIILVVIILFGTVMIGAARAAAADAARESPTLTFFGETFPEGGRPEIDVILDAGHGGIDSGTLHGNLQEKQINLEIALLCYDILRNAGVRVALNRNDDRALSDDNRWLKSRSRHRRDLAQRGQLANDLQPKMLVSLHVNWSKDAGERGPIVLHQKNEQSRKLAQLVQQSLNAVYGTASQPLLGKTYYLLNHVRCPAVIVEMGYISNADDRRRLTSPNEQKEIAEAICSAIIHYLNAH